MPRPLTLNQRVAGSSPAAPTNKINGPLTVDPLIARSSVIRRAPNNSIEKAQRAEEAGAQGSYSRHLRRLLRIKRPEGIEDEWRANSARFGEIGPRDRKRRLLFDVRLRRIARAQRWFAKRIRAGL